MADAQLCELRDTSGLGARVYHASVSCSQLFLFQALSEPDLPKGSGVGGVFFPYYLRLFGADVPWLGRTFNY